MKYWKYQRTSHIPFSPGFTSDDIIADSMEKFYGKEVIATEKKDGENSSLYPDHFHARSLDSRNHPSRNWLKAFHGSIAHKIPKGYRICGENLYAKHSIFYEELESYFYGFSIWDERNVALDWDTTVMWFEELGITPVPVLMRGIFDENMYKELKAMANSLDTTKHEGFVLRLAGEIPFDEFGTSVVKWVRKGHVVTDTHWMHAEVVPNRLKGK
jgi:hypothetical protein